MPPKKRGRKPKGEKKEKALPKKRGRKPKGGKIIKKNENTKCKPIYTPNIILHLKTSNEIMKSTENLTQITYNPIIEDPQAYNINTNKSNLLQYEELMGSKKEHVKSLSENVKIDRVKKNGKRVNKNEYKEMWNKLNVLKKNLAMNNISEQSSDCFWCTCYFDNPTIYIPKNINCDKIEVYGCFCSPECALSFLKKENIDTSTMWNRYTLLNNMYGKIYNYDKNIKPAPSPYYTLDKYFGNLTIQEYRKLLTNDRLIMVVEKPLSKILPEIYEENNEQPDINNNLLENKVVQNSINSYKLKSNEVFKTKTDILKDTFKVF